MEEKEDMPSGVPDMPQAADSVTAREWMLEDLRKSGLSDDTIAEMGVRLCPQGHEGTEELKRTIGFGSINNQPILQATDVYFFPYPETDFVRAKLRFPIRFESREGAKPSKYLGKSKAAGGDEGKYPYILPADREKLGKARNIWITEGEKKAALLSQTLRNDPDSAAVGLPGVWMIPQIREARGKTFLLAYDSDFRENHWVQLALASLSFQVLACKATPKLVSWPASEGKGIDDHLAPMSAESRVSALASLASSASSVFPSLSLLKIDDIARQAAKTKASLAVIETWFAECGLKSSFGATKKGFVDLVSAARQHSKKAEKTDPQKEGSAESNKDKDLGAVFEEDSGKTWEVRSKETESGSEETLVLAADFVMRLRREIVGDEGQRSSDYEIKHAGKSYAMRLTGEEAHDVNAFRKLVGRFTPASYRVIGANNHEDFVRHVRVYSSLGETPIPEIRETAYFGKVPGADRFVSGNCVAVPGGTEELAGLAVPKSVLRLEMPAVPLEDFWQETVSLFRECYGSEAWKILGFAAATLYAQEISSEYAAFPILFLNGGMGTGKSCLASLITSMFGASRELKPFNFNSTAKARLRQSEKYRGMPLTFNEFQPSQKNNSLVQALYDREGYQRALSDNTLSTLQSQVNSTFILISTRNITGYESQAVCSRLVTVDFERIKANKQAYMRLRERERVLSSFPAQALRMMDRKRLFAEVDAGCIAIQSAGNVGERIAWTHELFRVFGNAFCNLCETQETERPEIVRSLQAAQSQVAEANAGMLFLKTLVSMVENGQITGSIAELSEHDAARWMKFSLAESYPQVKRAVAGFGEKQDLPDEKTLGKLLDGLGVKNLGPARISGKLKRLREVRIIRNDEEADKKADKKADSGSVSEKNSGPGE